MPTVRPLLLATALAFAATAGLARADAEPARPETEPAAPSPEAAAGPSPARGPLDGWRHGLSAAWDVQALWSKAGSHYTFQSVAASYVFSTARSGVFVHLNVLFPLQARQDGNVYAVGDYYKPALGLDLLAGWEWRLAPAKGLELELGPGIHAALLTLNGNSTYVSFSTAPVGVGGEAILRWRPGWAIGSTPVSLGAVAAGTVDFFDPLHGEDLKLGLSFRLGVVAGLDLD